MAWLSFIFGSLYVFLVLRFYLVANKEALEAAASLSTFSISALGFFGTIIAAYIGASTYHDVKTKNQ